MLICQTPHLLIFPWRIPKLCKYSTARMSPIEMLIRISQVSGAESSCKEVRKKMVFYRIKNCKTLVVLKTKDLVLVPSKTSADLNQKFGPRQKLMISRPRKEPILIYCAAHFACHRTQWDKATARIMLVQSIKYWPLLRHSAGFDGWLSWSLSALWSPLQMLFQ